jgi:hypothetical protein
MPAERRLAAAKAVWRKPSPSKIVFTVLVIGVLLLIAVWESGATTQVCQFDQNGEPNNCITYSLALFILMRSADIANYYGPLIIAIAAAAIAWFAWTLRRSNALLVENQRQRTGAEEQRYRVLDRAYIAVSAHGIGVVPIPEAAKGKVRTVAGISIDNNGHTPAFLRELYGEFRDSSPVGEEPTYRGGTTWELNFQVSGRKSEIYLDKEFPFFTTSAAPQYFLGYVTYDDVYGLRHTARFCAFIIALS